MTQPNRRAITLLALGGLTAGLAAAIPGCTAPVAVAAAGIDVSLMGAQAYIKGDLEATHVASMEQAFLATLKALEDLQMPSVRSEYGDFVSTIRAMDDAGRRIRIELRRLSPAITKITIRVGLLGDETPSRLLMATVRANLPAEPTAPDED